MKRQIRRGVFETNSSSTHSITMCMKSDYDRWSNGEGFFYTGSDFGYPDNKTPQKGHFYTKDEVIDFLKVYKYCPDNVDWEDEDEVKELLRKMNLLIVNMRMITLNGMKVSLQHQTEKQWWHLASMVMMVD